MSTADSNRITFEEVAVLYNDVQPSYPDALINDIIALSGITDSARILEIGCGPGNATILFAERGYTMVGVELGKRLAAFATEKCRDFPGVKIVNAAFEDWPLEENAFDLTISADAFHWIPPEIGYPKVARALKKTGTAAFFWNVSVYRPSELIEAIDQVYQTVAPDLTNPDHSQGLTPEWVIDRITTRFNESGFYGQPTAREYPCVDTCSSEQYVKMLWTYSVHRNADRAKRENLYQRIKEVIDRAGGTIDLTRHVTLVYARVDKI